MTLPKLWDATAYGWGVVYCLTVEGVDLVFAERELGLTLPGSGPFADYSDEDGSLVIDDSAPVGSDIDRSQGVGVGLSLGFALLDTASVRTSLLAPTYTAKLTANVAVSDDSVSVDDNTAWPTSGTFWLGIERVTYSGKGGSTSFTGCTRGTAGGKASAHKMGSASGIVTSSPRWWIGRECTLWAYAVDPIGQVPGTTYGDADNVVCIWRGYIEDGPQRIPAGFRFEASSLDRRLDRPFQAKVTGKIVGMSGHYPVQPTSKVSVTVHLVSDAGVLDWGYTITFSPFSALSAAQVYSGAALREAIESSFAAALLALGAPATDEIVELRWVPVPVDIGAAVTFWRAQIVIDSSTLAAGDRATITINGSDIPSAARTFVVPNPTQDWGAPGAFHFYNGFWDSGDNPLEPFNQSMVNKIAGLTIALDDGDPSLVVSPATIEVDIGGDAALRLVCFHVADTEGLLYVSGWKSVSANAAQAPADLRKSTATVLYSAAGSVRDLLLNHLHSSGTAGDRDPTFDVYPRAQGYGLETSRVNQSSFNKVEQGTLQDVTLDSQTGDRSLVGMFSGLLALAGLAIVARVDVTDTYRAIKLQMVHATLGGSGGVVSIGNADLLTLSESPVEVLDRARPVNLVKLDLDGDNSIVYTDAAAVETFGTVEQTWTIPHDDREFVYELSSSLVTAYVATQPTIQTLALRVGPNVDAHVGDTVSVDITHPAIYDWQTGAQGYVGSAVVLGRSFDLRSMSATLTIAVSGSVKAAALSPAMLISAQDPGLSVDVDRGWYTHLAETLTLGGGAFNLIVYDPGSVETAANFIECDAVTDTGAVCRIGYTALSAGTITTGTTYCTLPETAAATDYQDTFAHTDTDGSWI